MSEQLHTGRVLLVEDDLSGVELLRDILTSVGNKVATAEDGREALALVDTFAPQVILLDLQMPGRDGFELARLIRVNPRQTLIPIIMMSGLTEAGIRNRAMECGADDFIAKPLRSEDLVLRVANGLRLLRMRRKIASQEAEIETLKSTPRRGMDSAESLHVSIEEAAAGLHFAVEQWANGLNEQSAVREQGATASRLSSTPDAEMPRSALPNIGSGESVSLPG